MTDDPFAAHRPLLVEELRRAVDGVSLHNGAVLRQQVSSGSESDAGLLPGLLCLLTAEALSGRAESALPAATALTLLTTMAEVFGTISVASNDEGLIHSWGMPRTLNAGDACFALAQETLLKAHSLDAGRRLKATGLLDRAARATSDSLFERASANATSVSRAELLSAAMALGALSAGANDQTVEQMGAYGRSLLSGRGEVLPGDLADRLSPAAAYVAEVRQ
ncbi:MAG: hypothetical protein GEU75_05080 [Dehalococcoidia bacterium]|nr:hypothetical protein [Dehalococcoidia bacterium]